MYYLANEIVAIIGFEELLVCILGFFTATFLWISKGKAGYVHVCRWAVFAPFALSCYLVLSGWQVHSETLELLRGTDSLSPAQSDVFWGDMYWRVATILGTGILVSLMLFVCFCRTGSSGKSANSNRQRDTLAGTREKEHSKPV